VSIACFDILKRNELLGGNEGIEKEKKENNDCPLFLAKKKDDLDNALKVMKYLWDECDKSLSDCSTIL